MNYLYVCILAIIATASATHYCSREICRGVPHIACNHSGNFARNCPSDATMVAMTPALMQLIVNEHNQKRNFIAGGGDRNHRPACRMATMQWDNELATLAALNVRQCRMAHDRCRNTDAFSNAGQNLAFAGFFGNLDAAARVRQGIQMWYDEVRNSRQAFIDRYPRSHTGPPIGHFTVMMADRNIRVGCAASTYSAGRSRTFLFACNYATTNMINFPIYASCPRPATSCTTGTNPAFRNLCSTREIYRNFARNCPADAAMVAMTPALMQLIVNEHNQKRNFIAGGGDRNHRPACRMATMQWDNELATLAALNVRQCTMAHDRCHNTDAFSNSGQNLAFSGSTGNFDAAARVRQGIQMWYDEVSNSRQAFIDRYPSNHVGPPIGHFTVMMADRNIRVGCGASTYSAGRSRNFLFACNYATTNMVNFPIYASCPRPATSCTTGTNPAFRNLCSTREVYRVNNFP